MNPGTAGVEVEESLIRNHKESWKSGNGRKIFCSRIPAAGAAAAQSRLVGADEVILLLYATYQHYNIHSCVPIIS